MSRARFAERQLAWLQYCYQQRLLDEQIAKAQQHAKTLSARLSPPSEWDEWELPLSRSAHSLPHAAPRVCFAQTALVAPRGALDSPKSASFASATAAQCSAASPQTHTQQSSSLQLAATATASTSQPSNEISAAPVASSSSSIRAAAAAANDSPLTSDSFLVTLAYAISLLGRRLLASASHNNHLAEYVSIAGTFTCTHCISTRYYQLITSIDLLVSTTSSLV